MTPPDSDAREVAHPRCLSCNQSLNVESPSCQYATRHYVGPRHILVTLSLAQRILAALELQVAREQNAGFDGTADRLHGLAAELRERLPKERK